MRAMVLTGLNQLEIIEKANPVLKNPDDVLIKVMSVGICGSDIHYYTEGRIGSQVVQYPFTVGHEGAGIIEQVGSAVTILKKGDRVAIDPAMPCYHCDQCKAGRYHTCRNLKFLGCPGQAEGCLFPVDNNISTDEAALSEPLAIGVYATRLAGSLKGLQIGILGSGPIGISVLLPALHFGAAKVYMTDKIDQRLNIARELGAFWTGNPDKEDIVKEISDIQPFQLDMVFECCGKQEAVDQAVQLLKPGGKLIIIGIPSFSRWSFDVDMLRRKEIDIQHVRRQNESVETTLDLISKKLILPRRMQTHTFPFEQIKTAFDMVAGYKEGVMKAMINFSNA
jgi:L-iditol 2-dehydrogenase